MSNPPHYSPFQVAGPFLLTSGQLPILDMETKQVPDCVREQTIIVLQKVESLLQQQQMDRSHIVKTTAFITDVNDWDAVNDAYKEFFGDDHKPARSVIPCSDLHFGCKIELEAIAYISS